MTISNPHSNPLSTTAPTKSEYNYKKHYNTSYAIGSQCGYDAVRESTMVPQTTLKAKKDSVVHKSLSDQTKPIYSPNQKFSLFETTNQREFTPKESTVTETYRRAPEAAKVEALWHNSALKQTAAQVLDQPQNLSMTSEIRDSFKQPRIESEAIRQVELKHAQPYYDQYSNFKSTLTQQNVPVSLMYKDRFKTTDQLLHDRKKQVKMNMEHKDLQYRDEQPRGRSMKSSTRPQRNMSTIVTKDHGAKQLRTNHFQKLDSIGHKTHNSEQFVPPDAHLNGIADVNSMPIKSQKMLRRVQHRNYGNMERSTVHESYQDITPALKDPNRDHTNPIYRKPQTFKKGIHGETILTFDRTRNVDE